MEHEGDVDIICIRHACNNPQRVGKETRRIGNQRKNRDYSDYSIVKID